MKIEIPFTGHKNILSLHKKTIEITKDSELSVSGDCIVGTNSTIACIDLPEKFKKKIRNSDTMIIFTIVADEHSFSIRGKGSNKLTLKHELGIGYMIFLNSNLETLCIDTVSHLGLIKKIKGANQLKILIIFFFFAS